METSFRSFFLWTAPSSGLLVPGAPATEAARTATSSCFVSARWGVSAQTTWGKTEHQKDQGNACNFRWFQHQFLQKLVDVWYWHWFHDIRWQKITDEQRSSCGCAKREFSESPILGFRNMQVQPTDQFKIIQIFFQTGITNSDLNPYQQGPLGTICIPNARGGLKYRYGWWTLILQDIIIRSRLLAIMTNGSLLRLGFWQGSLQKHAQWPVVPRRESAGWVTTVRGGDVSLLNSQDLCCKTENTSFPVAIRPRHTKGCLGDAPVAEERCRGWQRELQQLFDVLYLTGVSSRDKRFSGDILMNLAWRFATLYFYTLNMALMLVPFDSVFHSFIIQAQRLFDSQMLPSGLEPCPKDWGWVDLDA